MNDQIEETPKRVDGEWTCPPGYAHGKCYRCGHNFYEGKPHKMVGGKPIDLGPCGWCLDEE